MNEPIELDVHALTPARWPDLQAVFQSRGCSVARGCWCMYYRESGQQRWPAGQTQAQVRKRRLRGLTEAGPPPGLIGYRDGTPVGWVTLGPREAFAKLARSPVMKPVDGQPVWSVVCFVVPAACRGQGVASALLAAAVEWARAQGAEWLEAYPVDRAGPARDDGMWFGAKAMYDRAGFTEVARRKPERPVMRLSLARSAFR